MAKSYPDQLGEWIKRQEKAHRDRNLVAFLAVIDDVRAALDTGFAVKSIWTNMHEARRVEFGYDAFLKYVHRLIPKSQDPSPGSTPLAGSAEPARHHGQPPPSAPQRASPRAPPAGFIFDATPKKEDLL